MLIDGFPAVSGVVDSLELRKHIGSLITRDKDGAVRPGILADHYDNLVTGRSDMRLDVAAFRGVEARRGGAVLLANDATTQTAELAIPASNSWVHVLYTVQNESSSPFGDANDLPIFGIITGDPAPNPSVPVLNIDGAVKLAEIKVSSGAVATNNPSTVEIKNVFQFTALHGGTVPVRDASQMNAWTPADGAEAYRLDLKLPYRRAAGAWRPSAVRSYSFAKSSDSDGFLDIPHDLGVDPAGVSVTLQVGGGGDAITKIQGWVLWGKSSTNIRLRMIRQDTNQYLGGNPFSGIVTLNAGI